MLVEVALCALVLYLSYRWFQKSRLPLPRLGPPTVFGYFWAAGRFTFYPDRALAEGRARFSGRPYVMPSFGGPLVIVGGQDTDFWRSTDDTVFNQPAAVVELLAMRQTMNDDMFIGNTYHIPAIRTDLTRAIPALIPELVEESELALNEALKDSSTITVFDTMTHLVARISNRALVGKEFCRNTEYTHAVVHFAETLVVFSYALRFCPVILRDALYFVLSSLIGGKEEALKPVTNFLKEYLRDRDHMEEKPLTVTEFIIRVSPPNESLSNIGLRLLTTNFGSIHTTSILITQTLLELAVLSESQLEETRIEIQEALAKEGGWNKASLARFNKLDSILREVGRHHFALVGLTRRTLKDGTLPDGSVIPPGYTAVLDMEAVHKNPKIYPNPDVFDPFRFSKLREQNEGNNAKYLFTNIGKEFLVFGAGRHACPGRFFVAMELKVMLALILLHYDFEYPSGINKRPKDVAFDLGVIPAPGAKLTFRRRGL